MLYWASGWPARGGPSGGDAANSNYFQALRSRCGTVLSEGRFSSSDLRAQASERQASAGRSVQQELARCRSLGAGSKVRFIQLQQHEHDKAHLRGMLGSLFAAFCQL